MWKWILFVSLNWICVTQVVAGPQYMVAIPAVMEAGSEAKFCVNLMQPNETLTMTITLVSDENSTTLFQESTDRAIHRCLHFQTPGVQTDIVQNLEVSVQGETFMSTEQRKVMFRSYRPMTFVQTDKPLYLPGQTVNFRVITLDSKFRPLTKMYDTVEIVDTSGNRIGQWLNITSDSTILQLSYSLNSEAPEGNYGVRVSIDNANIYHNFKVEKYVLPKFEVQVNSPEEISVEQKEFKTEICATYTFGQPVPGKVVLELTRPLENVYGMSLIINSENSQEVAEKNNPYHKETKQTNKDGCATFNINVSTFLKLNNAAFIDKLFLNAKMEEEGTGVIQHQGKTIILSYVAGKLSFIDTPKLYESGSTIDGKVKLVSFDNTPIPNTKVYLLDGEKWSARLIQNLTTDENGFANFSLNTTTYEGDIKLQARIKPGVSYHYRVSHFEDGEHTIALVQPSTPDTKTVSFLKIKNIDKSILCNSAVDVTIQYAFVGESSGIVNVICLILARGAIIKQNIMKATLEDGPVTEGELSFKVEVSPGMAPLFQVVAYTILPSETVIAHSMDFNTEKCFSHKVSLRFSPSTAVPGEGNTLQVSAQPNSLCGISAVDQSVLIKEPGKKLDADKIFNLLPVKKSSYIPYGVEDTVECLHVRPRRYVIPYPGNDDINDAFSVFESSGLKMATNMVIRVPSCLTFKGRDYYHNRGVVLHSYPMAVENRLATPALGGASRSLPQPIETVRQFFPETWIWDLVEVGESGIEDVPQTVPDTITSWETEAFCLSSQGFGLAPPEKLTVFQPFFLELTLPYSIIRGEHFELKATVFNYLASCIMVTVTPAPSPDFTLTPISGTEYSFCLCANERKTVSWTMAPSVLGVVNVSVNAEAEASDISCNNEIVTVPERGRIDIVTRSLKVMAEGIEQTNTQTWLICPNGESLKEETELQLPEDVIDGSAHASVSVLGDILGRAMKNLDGLLRMPYGCGEQNMALLAPNVYILEYLRNTQQLTSEIEKKALPYLASGYQRQLIYKHHNGAYSTFGQGKENTWLSAFVLRTFARAKSFTFIDPNIMEETKTFLTETQRSNGCFIMTGQLFNNRMKGGVSDEVTITAYITAALLEMNVSASNPVVNNSLSCLRMHASEFRNTYTTALMAYTFTLAGDMETRTRLLQHLKNHAIQDPSGTLLHWSQTSSEPSASLSVEISSYVLLAILSFNPTAEQIGYASRIVRWLSGQQNSYGGFSSTQDTVVALQALALYSTVVFSPEGSSTVTVQTPSGSLAFDVNQNNKILYQQRELQDVIGKYSLEVKGTACASVQLSLQYNIPTPAENTSVSIDVKPEANCTSNSLRQKITLKIKSLYNGTQPNTNMVIVDIKLLSGFAPDPISLKSLKYALLVDRVDRKDDHVLMYLEGLPSGIPIYHQLDLVREIQVENLKPAVVTVYDYYQKSDQDETEYNSPCVAGN